MQASRLLATRLGVAACRHGTLNGTCAQLLGTAPSTAARLLSSQASNSRDWSFTHGSGLHMCAAVLGLGLGTLGLSAGDAHAAGAAHPSSTAPAAPTAAAVTPSTAGDGSLPKYTRDEVAKHRSKETGIWVTYKDGVYDITEFVAAHPGGTAKIMLAAGGAVDPFWSMYQQHQKAEIRNILEEYRIGSLEGGAAAGPALSSRDPWVDEPSRHPALIYRSEKPCNAESPGELLGASLVTPTDVFYVRNHLPVPTIDLATYKLRVEGEGLRTVELSLDELKAQFKAYTIAATLECAGNRRNEMKQVRPVKGLDWDVGAIGTAQFTGVRLRDVLKHAGLSDEDVEQVQHIHFVGLDADPLSGEVYAASIPATKGMSPVGDVLLAWDMNGQPLSRDHGGPLRAVVPGVVGARNVKWLAKVIASREESSSHWQQKDYKGFNPHIDWDTVDWASAPAIQEPPVTSAITEPSPGSTVEPDEGHITARGYAWSGGGKGIVRVDVSGDGGKTWVQAQLKQLPQKPDRAWAWTLWEASVPVPAGGTAVELCCKATDASYNTQPDTVAPIWNLRGVVNNAWHRVKVNIEQ